MISSLGQGSVPITVGMGRHLFGRDPEGYDGARPQYPDWVYQELRIRCGLGSGSWVFEVGAGSGLATRPLLEAGVSELVAIEPDPRLADFLAKTVRNPALSVVVQPFEDASLEPRRFDLGICATALHWLDEAASLRKVSRLLKPGGWWAAFWNIFGDGSRADPFHDATVQLLGGHSGPATVGDMPFGLDRQARTAALRQVGSFDIVETRSENWALELDAEEVIALYASFSNVSVRDDREFVLQELGRIAREMFGGRVVRNMTTILYLARSASDLPSELTAAS